MKHGSYIFNPPQEHPHHYSKSQQENLTPVAFAIQNGSMKWLFIFDLTPGWTREEIEFSINTIRKVLNARIANESFRNSMRQAELIQQSLLPKGPIEFAGFEIAGDSISTDIVGGDLFDFIHFDDDHFGIAVGDSSGHGLPAALLVRDVVTGLRMGLEKEMKITPVLEKLNRVIHRSTLSTAFISLFYGEIEANGNVVYTNAGHPPPILFSGEHIEMLDLGGLVLGPMPEVKLRRGFARMNPGNVLVMYSDGLIERQNRYGIQFELDRVKKIVIDHQHRSAENIKDILIESAFNYGEKGSWKDDVTVVVVKRKPETA
ncbi:MAG: PP2C family protein-serine/threonine phosphatase [Candidatus Zhuqueibacterota bacterium]